jgi:hypothetical protein
MGDSRPGWLANKFWRAKEKGPADLGDPRGRNGLCNALDQQVSRRAGAQSGLFFR